PPCEWQLGATAHREPEAIVDERRITGRLALAARRSDFRSAKHVLEDSQSSTPVESGVLRKSHPVLTFEPHESRQMADEVASLRIRSRTASPTRRDLVSLFFRQR